MEVRSGGVKVVNYRLRSHKSHGKPRLFTDLLVCRPAMVRLDVPRAHHGAERGQANAVIDAYSPDAPLASCRDVRLCHAHQIHLIPLSFGYRKAGEGEGEGEGEGGAGG